MMPYGRTDGGASNAPSGAAPGGREHPGAWWHQPPHWALKAKSVRFDLDILVWKTEYPGDATASSEALSKGFPKLWTHLHPKSKYK